MQVIFEVKRFRRVLEGIELHMIDIAVQTPLRGNGLGQVVPFGLGHAPVTRAHRPIPVSLGSEFEVASSAPNSVNLPSSTKCAKVLTGESAGVVRRPPSASPEATTARLLRS